MDADALYLTLAALAFAVALNLRLTLAVLDRTRRAAHPATMLRPGEQLPDVGATMLAGGAKVRLGAPGQALALLFLSSRCPKCRDKLAGIGALAGAAGEAGLAWWIVSEESRWRLRSLLRGSALAANTLRVGQGDYRRLNPTRASPAYLFVNHEGRIEAVGLVGDGQWRELERQLTGEAIAEHAA